METKKINVHANINLRNEIVAGLEAQEISKGRTLISKTTRSNWGLYANQLICSLADATYKK
jgi:hypothetical protein